MTNAEEYLNRKFPTDRENVKVIEANSATLLGHLDLSEFPNLRRLNVSSNYLKSIDISKNHKLEEVILYSNYLNPCRGANLENLQFSMFSHLANLKKLDLGFNEALVKAPGLASCCDFYGSLKALENCKNLEYLCIGYNANIKGGLEHLPLDNLKYFGCNSTEYKAILKPFDYDIKAWKIVNYPHLFNNPKQLITEKLEQTNKDLTTIIWQIRTKARIERLRMKKKNLEDFLANFKESDYKEIKIEKININSFELENQRLKNQVDFLRKELEKQQTTEKIMVDKQTQTDLTNQGITELTEFKTQIQEIVKKEN